LLIEIVSVSRPEFDTRDKLAVYSRRGVPWYWIVDPQQRQVTELRLEGAAYAQVAVPSGTEAFRAVHFPDLTIDLARLCVS